MRGVTVTEKPKAWFEQFQPALPMRGVTLNGVRRRIRRLISTRTPHAGSDACAIDLRKDIN